MSSPEDAASPPPLDELFRSVGAALFRRSGRVFGDAAPAAAATDSLFVRFVVHRRGAATDARARAAWIYRVATNHALQRLPDDARPGGGAPDPAARGTLPTMRSLRRLDEATRIIVVLSRLDGLSPSEIAEVIGSSPELVARKLAAGTAALAAEEAAAPAIPARPSAVASSAHPSLFALDVAPGDPSVASHLAGCPRCRADVEAAARVTDGFVRGLDAGTLGRVAAAVRAERARLKGGPGLKRALVMVGALALITIMAFVVARPRTIPPDRLPFRGPVTASRAKAAGIQITVRRGVEILALGPGATLKAGDRLHFRVRAEGPRYLEIHVRGPGGDARVFPADGDQAALVHPGQSVDHDYLLDGANAAPGGKLWIVASFAEHPFALDAARAPDVEVVPVRVDVEP